MQNEENPPSQKQRFASYPDEAWVLASVLDQPLEPMLLAAKEMSKHVKKNVITTNAGKKQRTIFAPSAELKFMHRLILSRCLGEDSVDYGEDVHGFVPGRGTLSNASRHQNNDVVVNIDLKDFFPSIKPGYVFKALSRELGFGRKNTWLLTQLCTYEGQLPQGFPTSPAIANLVAKRLDRRLAGLAEKTGLVYTRYADDLTFSGSGGVNWLIKAVTSIASDCGFTVHPEKIAVMRRGRRQRVTGLVVNDDHGQPRVEASRMSWLRSACFHWSEHSQARKQEIRGWISYVHSVNPEQAERLIRQIEKGVKIHG